MITLAIPIFLYAAYVVVSEIRQRPVKEYPRAGKRI